MIALCLLEPLSLATIEPAEPPSPSEYEVKAAFIYNFAKFVEWPREALPEPEPFVISVLGDDPFGTVLTEALRGKTVEGRSVVLRHVSRVQDVGHSQLLFISDSEKDRLASILRSLDAAPILTVGQMNQFAARGGIIGFRIEGERIRLDISLTAAERSKLKISSQLLRIARVVDAGGG